MATRLTPRHPVARTAVLLLGWAAVLVFSRTSDLNGQTMQLRPHVGLTLPTRISLQNGDLHLRQKVGMTVGAQLTVTFNRRFDAVTGVSYSPGYALFHGAGRRVDVTAQSHRLAATTGARYWLLPPARRLSWEVHTGLGMVFGGQPAYQDLFESSTLSGILGTSVRYQIGRIAGGRLKVQDRLYRVRFGSSSAGSSRSPLQISFGLDLPFARFVPTAIRSEPAQTPID
jgi:hypothetical protein